jgi:hypothetical protein
MKGRSMSARRIAYYTTDEVNFNSATQAARECGVSLRRLPHSSVRSGGTFSGVLYDLDHLLADRGDAIVNELSSRPAPCPAAVHGYNLGEVQMTNLHANGVIVSRTFDLEIVRALCRASELVPASLPDPDEQESLEVLDDPAVLCEMVRKLAGRAHRTMGLSSERMCEDQRQEVRECQERLDHLQQQIIRLRRQHDLRLDDLQRWLESLRRLVEGILLRPADETKE